MRLYSVGSQGPEVADIRDRLAALGFASDGDPRSHFGQATRHAVAAFQRAKRLDPDGIVGPETWRALYEAGYRLGDRLLYLRRPMLRGEDVAELQSRLNSLGFDAGKVDGIFGPDTESAVIDFQRNRNLAEDGKVGPTVLTEIRLVTRGEMRESLHAIREREWMRRLPATMAGAHIFLDAGCRDHREAAESWDAAMAASLSIQAAGGLPMMSRSQDVELPERVRARRANRVGADLIVAFRLDPEGGDRVFYFASEYTSSAAGEHLARAISSSVGGVVTGRAGAILKETRAPAAVVSRSRLDGAVGRAVTEGLERFFALAATTR
jgi:N-acetylmuramoyl-L-alanine amidase